MKIVTGLKVLLGAGLGFMIGINVTEDEKEKLVSFVKGRLVYAITGDPNSKQMFNKKDYYYKKPDYASTYTTYKKHDEISYT